MQRAGSLRALDRAPTTLAHQLPRAVGSAFSLTAVPATAVGQARASPHGQHCGGLVHQPAGRYTITARPPSPPLESHAVQVTELRGHTDTSHTDTVHIPIRLTPKSSHCQLYFSLTEGPLGTDALAHSWPRALRKYAFPPLSLLAQTLCKLREDEEQVLLVAPHWTTRTWFPELISLATAPLWHIPLRKEPRSMEPPCVAPGRDPADLSGLLPAVVETIIQARAPSTRQTYALKWSLFATWCSSRREDPRRCTIGVVLSFLQERLERRLSPSTLKVYVAAIATHHDAVDGRSLGKHDLIVRFLKGARRMIPSRSHLVPSWDLSIVLAGLQRGPFEPLDSVKLKFLSLKTALLTALTSIKWVGDLQAFSESEECLVFGPVFSQVVLRPRPGYVPKVPTTPFRDQVVNLQALPSEEADPALALLCPVRILRIYVDRTRSIRSSEQLFVCHGGQQKGKAVSQTEVGPLDSGGRRLGVPVARRAMPPGGEGSLH